MRRERRGREGEGEEEGELRGGGGRERERGGRGGREREMRVCINEDLAYRSYCSARSQFLTIESLNSLTVQSSFSFSLIISTAISPYTIHSAPGQ